MEGGFSWQSPSAWLVLTAALDLLAEHGYEGLTVADLRLRAGPAGAALDDSPDIDDLIVVALEEVRLLTAPPPSGSLEADLQALLDAWRAPCTRDERVIAAVLSAAEWRPHLKHAVAETLDRQVSQAVGSVLGRALRGGVAPCDVQTVGWLLCGLMLERLRTGPRSAVDLRTLIAFLLRGMAEHGGPADRTDAGGHR